MRECTIFILKLSTLCLTLAACGQPQLAPVKPAASSLVQAPTSPAIPQKFQAISDYLTSKLELVSNQKALDSTYPLPGVSESEFKLYLALFNSYIEAIKLIKTDNIDTVTLQINVLLAKMLRSLNSLPDNFSYDQKIEVVKLCVKAFNEVISFYEKVKAIPGQSPESCAMADIVIKACTIAREQLQDLLR